MPKKPEQSGAMSIFADEIGGDLSLDSYNLEESNEGVQMIPTRLITPWRLANRPASEMDIEELAEDIKRVGQSVPALVRPKGEGYELIYGRRRFEAAVSAGLDLKCLVEDLSDSEAWVRQHSENNKRKELSAWANALDYKRALDERFYPNQKSLAESLGISKNSLSEHLTYFKLPQEIQSAIGDFAKVKIKTMLAIYRFASSEEAIDRIVEKADEIASGRYGEQQIEAICTGVKPTKTQKYTAKDKEGNALFTLSYSAGKTTIKIEEHGGKLAKRNEIKKVLEKFFEEKA